MFVHKVIQGELGMFDRITRVVIGVVALFALLQLTITSMVVYPYLSIAMAVVVLTGIIGWDPMYAMFRSIYAKLAGVSLTTVEPTPAIV